MYTKCQQDTIMYWKNIIGEISLPGYVPPPGSTGNIIACPPVSPMNFSIFTCFFALSYDRIYSPLLPPLWEKIQSPGSPPPPCCWPSVVKKTSRKIIDCNFFMSLLVYTWFYFFIAGTTILSASSSFRFLISANTSSAILLAPNSVKCVLSFCPLG